MTSLRTLSRLLLAGLLAASTLAPLPAAAQTAPDGSYALAQGGDCYAIGMRQAAQMGGQLARATPETRGGRRVCVIVVLMPARDGQRPRRNEIVVPAG